MAFADVSKVVLQLSDLLIQEGIFLYGTDDKIKWVHTELTRIQLFLENAQSKWNCGDAAVTNWVKEITNVSYKIEDLIDIINYKNEIRRQRKGFIGSVSRYAHLPSEIITLHKVGSKIDKIKSKLEDISRSKESYGIITNGTMGNAESGQGDDMIYIERFHSPHFVDDLDIVGFDVYMKKLICDLLNQGNQSRSVISIVGMGGLGKTTLARKVLSSPQVKENFTLCAWVVVSQKNVLNNLLKEIAKQVMNLGKRGPERSEGESSSSLTEKMKDMGELELKREIFEFLKGKKYLVMLDDVWSTDAWKKIGHIFPDNNNGSKVLLTTRDMEVAIDSRSTPMLLEVLPAEDSWELLRRKTFLRNDEFKVSNTKELEVLGRKLASRCGGLPLALVVLGGVLSRNVNCDSWSKILDTMNWESMTDGQRCLEILALSYKDLPNYHIKSCFLYTSLFPKDCLISPAKLTRLWIAEGLIPYDERRTLEEVAYSYLNLLFHRSLVQVAKISKTGERIKKIRIHDVLMKWCIKEAQKSGFSSIVNIQEKEVSSPSTSNGNRMAIHSKNVNELALSSLGNARTILTFGQNLNDYIGKIVGQFNLLRALDLQGSNGITHLPKNIGELIHLRYLGIRKTKVAKVPSSISQLLFLQTFDARGTEITKVPVSFWNIKSLVYIYLPCLSEIPDNDITQNIRKLYLGCTVPFQQINWLMLHKLLLQQHNLLSLTIEISMESYKKNFEEQHGKDRNALHNKIVEESRKQGDYIEKSSTYQKFLKHSQLLFEHRIPTCLISLFARNNKLQFLKLSGEIVFSKEMDRSMDQFLRGLDQLRVLYSTEMTRGYNQLPPANSFSQNLTELTLKMCQLYEDPMPVLGRLPCLKLLRLSTGSYSCFELFCDSGFPQLKHLSLEWTFISKGWHVQQGVMPILATLHINGCFYMDIIPIGLQNLIALKELRLTDIPMKIEKRVAKDEGEDWPIIRHIPSIILRRAW